MHLQQLHVCFDDQMGADLGVVDFGDPGAAADALRGRRNVGKVEKEKGGAEQGDDQGKKQFAAGWIHAVPIRMIAKPAGGAGGGGGGGGGREKVEVGGWWEGEGVHDLDDLLRAALFSDGMRAEEANRVGVDMSLDTEQLIRQRGDLQDGGDSPIRQ